MIIYLICFHKHAIRTFSESLSTQTILANKKGTTMWLSDEIKISSDRAAGRQMQAEREREREREREKEYRSDSL